MFYECVGVGFGPSNMALAIALKENNPSRLQQKCAVKFFEARENFSWHPGLLFPSATMQISFLKDLITTINPASEFTFLNFLHQKNRLDAFINLRTFYPRREEFDAYLRWVAEKLHPYVSYEKKVIRVELNSPKNPSNSLLNLTIQREGDSQLEYVTTRHLVLADGGRPVWPFSQSPQSFERVFHGTQTLQRLASLKFERDDELVFHIVGSGQSAADIFRYLSSTYIKARIVMTHRSFAMRPEDDSHFINELFLPESVSLFQNLHQEWRDKIVRDYWHVTHNGVTLDLIPKLYEDVYYDRALGSNRFSFKRFSEIAAVTEKDKKAVSTVRYLPTGETTTLESDAVILATGYERPCPHPLLEHLSSHLSVLPDKKSYDLDHSYRIKTTTTTGFNVFLQGYGERTHGFSEALLSLMPVRARAIAESIWSDISSVRSAV